MRADKVPLEVCQGRATEAAERAQEAGWGLDGVIKVSLIHQAMPYQKSVERVLLSHLPRHEHTGAPGALIGDHPRPQRIVESMFPSLGFGLVDHKLLVRFEAS